MTYDFTCPKCGSNLTITQSIHEPTPQPENCRCGTPMNRIWRSPGIEFRGRGWAGKP